MKGIMKIELNITYPKKGNKKSDLTQVVKILAISIFLLVTILGVGTIGPIILNIIIRLLSVP